MATIVDRAGMIVYELSSGGQGMSMSSRSHGFMGGFGMLSQKDNLGRTHGELLTVWKNTI